MMMLHYIESTNDIQTAPYTVTGIGKFLWKLYTITTRGEITYGDNGSNQS